MILQILSIILYQTLYPITTSDNKFVELDITTKTFKETYTDEQISEFLLKNKHTLEIIYTYEETPVIEKKDLSFSKVLSGAIWCEKARYEDLVIKKEFNNLKQPIFYKFILLYKHILKQNKYPSELKFHSTEFHSCRTFADSCRVLLE